MNTEEIKLAIQKNAHLDFDRDRFISASRILGSLEKEFDAKEMAQRCSLKQGHEMFGIPPEQIIQIWSDRGEASATKGDQTHDYIRFVLGDDRTALQRFLKTNQIPHRMQMCFLDFKNKNLNGACDLIDTEFKLFSEKHRVSLVVDAMFNFIEYGLYVFDWKTNEAISRYSRYKLLPPFDFLDNSKWNIYTLQLQIYQFILQEEYGLEIKGTRNVWLTEDGSESIKPKFPYDKEMIKDIIDFGVEKSVEKFSKK